MRNLPALLSIALFSLAFTACSELPQVPPPETKPIQAFASDVCLYPAKSPVQNLRGLGGKWAPLSATALDFNCVGGDGPVSLFAGMNSSISIGYAASGDKHGANLIEVEYMAANAEGSALENTYRTVYLNFLKEITRQAFGSELPELISRKISNTASYAGPGDSYGENIDIGNGFIELNRERSQADSSLRVTAKLFSDKNLKITPPPKP